MGLVIFHFLPVLGHLWCVAAGLTQQFWHPCPQALYPFLILWDFLFLVTLALISSSFKFLPRRYPTIEGLLKQSLRFWLLSTITCQCFLTVDVTDGRPGWYVTVKTSLWFVSFWTFSRACFLGTSLILSKASSIILFLPAAQRHGQVVLFLLVRTFRYFGDI